MAHETPRVSVGMPVFNGERRLRDAVESILNQSFQDLELIISDNASTDHTEGICRGFAKRDDRVRYFRNEKNLGISENYNLAFRRAKGPYFKWASSNDTCDPRFVEACVRVLEAHPDAVLAYPRTLLIREPPGETERYEDGLNLPQERACDRLRAYYRRVYLNNVMNGLMRAEILRKTPLIAPYLSSDIVLMGELALYGKFVEVPEFLFFRRMDRHSATAMQSKAEVIRHYDPERRGHMLFQRWRAHRQSFEAVVRVPLSLSERACLLRFLGSRMWRDRGYLVEEIREAGKARFGGGSSEAPIRAAR